MNLRTVTVTRYVTPLREGGSVPAIVEADDEGMYVIKFRGAGQGPKALIAELVAGEIARAAGLPVPEIVFIELDPDLARTEPDPELQDLIREQRRTQRRARLSAGRRDVRSHRASPGRAARLVDRVVRRLRHERRSHRAQHEHAHVASAASSHRSWRGAVLPSFLGRTIRSAVGMRFPLIKDHVLLPLRDSLAGSACANTRLTDLGSDPRHRCAHSRRAARRRCDVCDGSTSIATRTSTT